VEDLLGNRVNGHFRRLTEVHIYDIGLIDLDFAVMTDISASVRRVLPKAFWMPMTTDSLPVRASSSRPRRRGGISGFLQHVSDAVRLARA